MTTNQKYELLTKQKNLCALCHERHDALSMLEADHIVPLSQRGTNESSNWQLLCQACHADKSKQENFRSADPLLSKFAPNVYKSYVESPKPLPLVFESHKPIDGKVLYLVDVIRCRKNALYFCSVPIHCFSPLDSILVCN